MKKLILLLIVFTTLSCDDTINVEQNPERVTTLEILSNIDSTYQVSILKEDIYLFQDSTLIYHGEITSGTDRFTMLTGEWLVLILLLFVTIFIAIGSNSY